MGVLYEDVVLIREAENPGDPTVITVNCPDKTGLGCDLCRIILLFGLSISRGDFSTDGKWCYILFWVMGKPTTRWVLLKKRLLEVCPSYFSTTGIYYYQPENQQPKQPDVFLLKFWCSYDRKGLLHDVTEVLCELELTIKRVKVSTAPDEKVMDLFFVTDTRLALDFEAFSLVSFQSIHVPRISVNSFTPCASCMWDPQLAVAQLARPPPFVLGGWGMGWGHVVRFGTYIHVPLGSRVRVSLERFSPFSLGKWFIQLRFFIRELLHTKKRQEETIHHLKAALDDIMISCEIELAGPEFTACSQGSPFLPSAITEDMFCLELAKGCPSGCLTSNSVSVTMDNTLSPSHTLVRILCQDHKGLIYDIMRTLKDYNVQVSYGRFFANSKGNCEVELFITQADAKKVIDPSKQNALCSRIRMELSRPLRVAVISRGPDTELLVANPVELSGRGRPLVFYDIALALKILNTNIFSVEIGRHMICGREWEVYRILLEEGNSCSLPKKKLQEGVRNRLMGWE
ncbi:hypothetical protein CJ030_MR3G015059 [Morella rubra]|uniref:ACT domain-containing protein ACR n=1 Tax=Morella rubra TaxID=262757 RepID=A0A6A1W1Q4_9ROSI|nr:hypothetical protein CJ030_MR3G015059 [Morella rubra]